jgi:hypothetical protein
MTWSMSISSLTSNSTSRYMSWSRSWGEIMRVRESEEEWKNRVGIEKGGSR